MFKPFKSKLLGAGVVAAVVTTSASAALTAPTFDTSDVTIIAGAVLVGLASIWAIKAALRVAK